MQCEVNAEMKESCDRRDNYPWLERKEVHEITMAFSLLWGSHLIEAQFHSLTSFPLWTAAVYCYNHPVSILDGQKFDWQKSDRSEKAGRSGRAVDAAKAFIFQESGARRPGMMRLWCNLRLEPTEVNVQCFIYNHLEIGDESQITAGGWRNEKIFSFKKLEQVLRFTCDINLYFLNSRLHSIILVMWHEWRCER